MTKVIDKDIEYFVKVLKHSGVKFGRAEKWYTESCYKALADSGLSEKEKDAFVNLKLKQLGEEWNKNT